MIEAVKLDSGYYRLSKDGYSVYCSSLEGPAYLAASHVLSQHTEEVKVKKKGKGKKC